ncbi:MAG: hypothetical protein ACOZF0_17830 [Thermodesulfobacteriota bacterium]
METTQKQVCECKHCGNEAEMVITCTLPDETEAQEVKTGKAASGSTKPKGRKKQSITCKHCGNEAEMWLDE